ncbi:MAG TPA: pyridoxal-phosphate dependent enzyme [Dongiaceae bacterium]|nr:pyridoxal-phosphate dependent enzyme [Dongiaceae bacterium]
MISLDDILAARTRIAPFTRVTPVMPVAAMRAPLPLPADVVFKLELFQVTGSFKARGAMNRYQADRDGIPAAGIVTASGGNHGLAVARTAHAAGTRATIFVPSAVRPEKVEKMRGWNADVRIVGDEWSVSNEAALAFAGETGAVYFHPFADPLVVAGQGTLGIEIVEQIPDLDAIVVAIGGGGLIAGLATAVKALKPEIRIIGVEPEGSPTLLACLQAGRKVRLDAVTSRVATMSCRETDQRIYDMVRAKVDEIVLVSDDAMLEASRWLWSEFGIAADLSGAASVAALRLWPERLRNTRRVCALVCGAGSDGIGG